MSSFYSYVAQTTSSNTVSSSDTAVGAVFWVFMAVFYVILLAFCVVGIIGMWKTFVKAGRPGWESIVPVYNGMVIAELAGKPNWWGLGLLVSPLSLILSIIFGIEIGKKFGRSEVFGVMALGLFPAIGYLMIGFGPDKYSVNQSASPNVLVA